MMDIRFRSKAGLNCSINENKREINCYNDEIFSEINEIDVQKDIKDSS